MPLFWGPPYLDYCRNPFVSQVNFFRYWRNAYWPRKQRRNPFVSQVNFFAAFMPSITPWTRLSQSLRKSGQFLLVQNQLIARLRRGRNPFVSQVNFFALIRDSGSTSRFNMRRNPFVSQVNFFMSGTQDCLKSESVLGRNPFVSQVNFFVQAWYKQRWKWSLSQSLRKSGQFLQRKS